MLILQAFIQSPGETFINLGFITIRWYGLLISVSVLIGLFVSKKLAKARNINPEYISEILPSLIISSIIGARAYYVIFEWRQYSGENFFTSFEIKDSPFQPGIKYFCKLLSDSWSDFGTKGLRAFLTVSDIAVP